MTPCYDSSFEPIYNFQVFPSNIPAAGGQQDIEGPRVTSQGLLGPGVCKVLPCLRWLLPMCPEAPWVLTEETHLRGEGAVRMGLDTRAGPGRLFKTVYFRESSFTPRPDRIKSASAPGARSGCHTGGVGFGEKATSLSSEERGHLQYQWLKVSSR